MRPCHSLTALASRILTAFTCAPKSFTSSLAKQSESLKEQLNESCEVLVEKQPCAMTVVVQSGIMMVTRPPADKKKESLSMKNFNMKIFKPHSNNLKGGSWGQLACPFF